MAKRITTSIYNEWNDLDQGIRRMGEIDIKLTRLEGDLTLKLNEIREDYDAKAEGLRVERKNIEGQITVFADAHKNEFMKTRSKELTFGTIAYRIVHRVAIRSKAATVAALEALGLDSYLRIIKEPDKDAMAGLEAGTLAKVGASLKTEDKIQIKPALDKIRGWEDAA
jgi:phage host-nuclease inhibitor protein Gam